MGLWICLHYWDLKAATGNGERPFPSPASASLYHQNVKHQNLSREKEKNQ